MGSLAAAFEKHQAGDLALASQFYEEALAEVPEDPEALHLLGVLRQQQGDYRKAIELINRALVGQPNAAIFHINLAEAYRGLGQFERAVGSCRMALVLGAERSETHNNLGLALQGLGRHAEAVEEFQRALERDPQSAFAHGNLGISLRELKRFDEALTHFRRAVELAPTSGTAQTNLGQMLIDRGLESEALPHCQEAARQQPDVAAVHHNLGHALRMLKRYEESRAAYFEAIRLDPNLAKSHAHLGLGLQEEGELAKAIPWLKRAAELEPNNAVFWEKLAELQAEREESADAIPCWRRVLELEPQRASAHQGLGWALQDEGLIAEAEEHYRAALRLQPGMAAAYVSLGSILEEKGDMAEAETAIREAMRLQPGMPNPLGRLATLLRGKLPDADLALLQQRLADPKLGDGPRARLLFGLAHVLDGRGDYAGAAQALREGNPLAAKHKKGRVDDYDPAEHDSFVGRMIDYFSADFFARTAGMGSQSRRPVFIVGMPRSGTTLLEQVLASHSQIHGAGELRFVRQSWEALPRVLERTGGPFACLEHLSPAALETLAQDHVRKLEEIAARPVERMVDKMPDNYAYLGFLAVLFPKATFIHCRRDLRDVAVSCWMTDFRSIRWANDLEHLATRLEQYRRLMDHWRKVLPVPVREIHYEDMVADLEGMARRLIAACGLEWEPACLRFHETKRPVRTASVTQVRKPIYSTSVARWRNYQQDLADCFRRLTPPSEGVAASRFVSEGQHGSEGSVAFEDSSLTDRVGA